MKRTLTLFFILVCSISLMGQQYHETAPFIIQGNINSKYAFEHQMMSKKVRIDYPDQFDQTQSDTADIDENGDFYIETRRIKTPVRFNLVFDFEYYQDLLAAPGYDITFVKQPIDRHTYKLLGAGSKASSYYSILDSIPFSKFHSIEWWNLNETAFINQLNRIQTIRDSISQLVFNPKTSNDKYFSYFGQMTRMDNKFERLKYLIRYAGQKKYSLGKSISFVRNNFDTDFFNDMSNDEYMISSEFRSGISDNWPDSFLNYLLLLNNPADTIMDVRRLTEKFKLERANTVFKNEVRSYVLFKIMGYPVWTFKSIEELNRYKKQLQPYISSLSKSSAVALQKALTDQMMRLAFQQGQETNEEVDKAATFIGKPVPTFSLLSNTGKLFKPEDFKGKVVLLNLWSSQCKPCLLENDTLKRLYRKYENDKRIAFISVALLDSIEDWKRIVKKDRTGIIQLFDMEGTVFDSYIDKRLPKYILIDKSGNIVNFMAPNPGKSGELEKLIRQEIEKLQPE